ncbi:MAG: sulfotransferase family 2 domain-containing protein [Acidimicrobiales bacterium]|nr:sulfotransferase family 2 domain-containing protein [Acidimicrobiales bacterium]
MTYLFLHVPKAAGTAYAMALARAVGGEHLLVDIPGEYSSEEFQQVDPESLRRYSFVGAHVDYGLVRRAPWLRPITVLRDPVDRVVSWYHYALRSTDEGLAAWRRFLEGRRLSIEEFLSHPQLRWLHGQSETMQLAGYLWSGDPIPHEDRLVPVAAENLASCAHVGLFERLGDSLHLARAELGLADVPALPDANVSPPRPSELDPEVRARVAEVLGMDSAF